MAVTNIHNIIILGVSCFDGMANSMRVRNLFEPLVAKKLISLHNLIYEKSNKEPIGKKGYMNDIHFKIIGFRLSNIFSVFGFIFGGFFFIKRSKKRGCKNIFYVFDYPDIKNLSFILYARLIGYKVVIEVVEDNRHELPVGLISKFRIKTSLLLANYSRYLADAMIGISTHLVNKLSMISRGRQPVYHVPITVNLNYFTKVNLNIDRIGLQIFYGGSYGLKDGLEHLLQAFDVISKKHTHVQLILTGIGHALDMERVQKQINNVFRKERIIYKGFLSTEDYYKTLNECDIFCMTRVNSLYANAGFPFKLGEFLAAGKAIVATDVGDVCDYLVNDVNALVIKPDSVDELVGVLSSIIENPGKIQSLGAEARKTAETHFDTEKVSLKLLTIFNDL